MRGSASNRESRRQSLGHDCSRPNRDQPQDHAGQAGDPRSADSGGADRSHKLAEDADEKALHTAYPTLNAVDIHAALRYPADSLSHEEVLVSAGG